MPPFNVQNGSILLRSRRIGSLSLPLVETPPTAAASTSWWHAWRFAWTMFQSAEPSFVKQAQFVVRSLSVLPWSLRWFQELARFPEANLNRYAHVRVNRLYQIHRSYYDVRLSIRQRLALLTSHRHCLNSYFCAETMKRLERGESLIIGDVSGKSDHYRLTLSLGAALREGSLVVALSNGDGVLVSAAVTIAQDRAGTCLRIGCVQSVGHNPKEAIKQATKDLEGIQPRLLLLSAIRQWARSMHVTRMEGIATEHHPFARGRYRRQRRLKVQWEPLWTLVGGTLNAHGNYDLPLDKAVKSVEQIASSKRAQWRRQQQLHAALAQTMSDTLNTLLRRA